eukprot:TRINITY_DN2874_c0_g1_i1.p5 TRINITY_DN2874_c0_g1~~TRINITY_DN2874_c0_g1_i1.p5  ORF type:complete len:64 (-),score=15.87 TRINITY_DN2874_c0_g1_i1:846-1037(-)
MDENMKFSQYKKMGDYKKARGTLQNICELKSEEIWIATEKVHGANFRFGLMEKTSLWGVEADF